MKKKISLISTVLILIPLTGVLWASQKRAIKFDRISLEQGLSQSAVNCITQDNRGFLWFGTQDGLNKYDGQNIKVYKYDQADPLSISNNNIRAICEDRDGILWIATNGGGLNKFDPDTEKAVRYRHDASNPQSLSHDNVFSLFIDSKGCLWIGTWGGGLNKFEPDKEIFTRYKHIPGDPKSLSNNKVRAIYEDSKGMLWVGTYGGGLNKFNREKGTFFCYRHDPGNPKSLSDERVMVIYESRSGILWLGTDGGGVNAFDRQKGTFKRYQHDPDNPNTLSHNRVRSIYEEKNGLLWIGTYGGGVSILSREKGRETFTHYQADMLDPKSLSNNRVMTIFKSKENLIWIGTAGGGINTSDRERKFFHCVRRSADDPNSLSDNRVQAFCEDKNGVLWIGTDGGGLNRLDRGKGIFTHYKHDPTCRNCISHNRVLSIIEDSSGVLWIAAFRGGLDRFDRKKGRFSHYRHDPGNPRSLSDNRVRTIYEDSKGVLWIGTIGGGLNRMDRETGAFTWYKNEPGNPYSLSNNSVYVICEGRTGILWIGTWVGLNKYDRKKNKFTRFNRVKPGVVDRVKPGVVDRVKPGVVDRVKPGVVGRVKPGAAAPKEFSGLSNDRVFSILEDSSGILWVGTDGGGLNRFDPTRKTWKHYSVKDGLPNDVINGILEETSSKGSVKNLWLSTNGGIARFNPRNEIFIKYDVKDGLQSYEFVAGAYYKSKKGEMFFGGINGFNHFSPDTIKATPQVNPVVITAFRKFNEITKFDKYIGEMKEIKLSYKDSFFSFDFVTPEFRNPDRIQYAYKLDGLDRNWVRCGTRRFVNYTNIPGGEYTFRVRSFNRDGGMSETSVKIRITPPFWQTLWFRILLFITIIFLAVSIHTIRTKYIKKRSEELEVIVTERTAELTTANVQLKEEIYSRKRAEKQIKASLREKEVLLKEIHHRVKNNLQTIISLLNLQSGYIEDKRALEVFKNSQERVRAMALIHEKLYESKDLSKIDFRGYISSLITSLLDSYYLNSGQVRLNMQIKDIELDIGRAIPLGLIINELVSNSLKHAFPDNRKGELKIKLGVSEDKEYDYTLIVRDNGIGFPEDLDIQNSNTLGIVLVNALTKQLHGVLDLDAKEGTTFTIKFKKLSDKKDK